MRSTQPALAAIKLAWWRERLEELDECKVPAEPRLDSAAKNLLTRGVSGVELAELEDGWAALLDEEPDLVRVRERGARFFGIASTLLKAAPDPGTADAGRFFAEVDLARRGLRASLGERDHMPGGRIPSRLRPVTALAALAVRDLRRGGPPFEPEATPGRAWTLLRHRLTGRF